MGSEMCIRDRFDALEMEESRHDPAFSDSNGPVLPDDINGSGETKISPKPPLIIPANVNPADVPSGWRLCEPLGRWINPEDVETWGKVPRNAACPCGKGKKFKHCHGKIT